MTIQPDWLRDLLGLWSSQDIAGELAGMGFAPVSPMFARLGTVAEADPDQSYSSLEVLACRDAVDALRLEDAAGWQALQRAMRPWHTRGEPPDPVALERACQWLAQRIDERMDL